MSSRNILLFFVAVVAALLIQTSLLPFHIVPYFKPDLLLIIMVFLALRAPFETGITPAWLLGLLKDVFSGLFLGLNACTFLIIFLVIRSVSERLYAESGFLFVITVSVATLACVTANLLLLLMFTQTAGISASVGIGLIPHLLVNAFAASLVALLPCFTRHEEVA